MWGMRDGIRNSEYIWEMCVSSGQAIGRARVNLGICGHTQCRGSSGTAFTQDSDRLSPVVRFRSLSYMTRTHLSKPNVNKIVHDNTYPPGTRSKKYIVCLYHHHLCLTYVANEFP